MLEYNENHKKGYGIVPKIEYNKNHVKAKIMPKIEYNNNHAKAFGLEIEKAKTM
jgi:hypothetical protein